MANFTHALDLLSSVAQPRHLKAGQLLFSEGAGSHGFWLLQSGVVRLYSLSENLREAEIHRCEAGDMVAAAIAIARLPFPHYGQATTECETLYYPTDQAVPLIAGNPQLATLFLRILAGKCRDLAARVSALQMQTVRDRLLYYLRELCPKNGTCAFRLPVSKKELAQQLGTSPETLSRILKELQDENILTMNNRNFIMHSCLRNESCQLSIKSQQ